MLLTIRVSLLLALPAAFAQTTRIQGTVTGVKNKPVSAALVIAVQNGLPPFTARTKSGADGGFQFQALPAGRFSLCVQAGDEYLDPCHWSGSPAIVTLLAGQAATGVSLRLTSASVIDIQVKDAQKLLSQKTKDGRRPDLTLGVWGPKGLYYAAHPSGYTAAPGNPQSAIVYHIAVPRDTALKLHIASRDVKLGDAAGALLPANASQQAFQHATGDPNSKSFAFTVLGLLP